MNDIQRFERIYGAAGRELRRILSLEPGIARVRAREIVKVLNAAVDKWANDAIPRAYAKGERTARTALEILGKKPRRPKLVDPRIALIDETMLIMIKANNSIPETIDSYLAAISMSQRKVSAATIQEFEYGDIVSKVDRLVASAIKQEQTRAWLSKVVREHLSKVIKTGDFIKINGRNYNMEKYAELVARTELRKANVEATLEISRQYENDLVQWSDHGTICDICKEFEGKVYSISGTSLGYPMLEEEPPAHPNCQHYLLCTSEEAIEVRKEYGETDWARQMREAKENKESMYEYAQRTFKEQEEPGYRHRGN